MARKAPISCDRIGVSNQDRAQQERERLLALAGPVVEDCAAQLVDVELVGPQHNRTVRILIHAPQGVHLGMCEQISRQMGDLLDVEDPLPGRYRLEVTSPGLDRPLKTDSDFDRACNRKLKVVLVTGHNVQGRLQAYTAENLVLEAKQGTCQIRRADIAKATIEAEL